MSFRDLVQSEDDAVAVGHAMLLAQALLDGPRDAGPRSFCYTTPSRQEYSPQFNSRPYGVASGIAAVGVVILDGRLYTALLEISTANELAVVPLMEAPNLHGAVRAVLRDGFNALTKAIVVRVSEPEFQAAPGDTVSTAAVRGTAGVQLNWGNGLDGILTAGHVGKPSGSMARTGGTNGTIVLTLDPTNHGKTPEADVSVIQLQAAVAAANQIASKTTAGPGDDVTVKARGRAPVLATIMGQLQWLWLPKSNCTCGHVYMTTACVTNKGDSGAPVLKNNCLVGHVIGASTGMTTYIQLFDYQLQEIVNRSGFSLARL